MNVNGARSAAGDILRGATTFGIKRSSKPDAGTNVFSNPLFVPKNAT
jgi:hypothetical protein